MVEVIVVAIEIGRSDADAATRSRAWALLAQTGNRSVVQPMTDALLYDPSAEVRATTAEWLFDYRSDPIVRTALESAAVSDASPEVRLRAYWSTLENDGRAAFVRTTLLDRRLTPEERIAPLIHARAWRNEYVGSSSDFIDSEIPAMDREALDTLAEIAASSDDAASRIAAVTELGLGGHRDFLALLQEEPDDRQGQILNNLFNRRQMPGVREFLEQSVNALAPGSSARTRLERSLAPP
jgi:hypothetical protein